MTRRACLAAIAMLVPLAAGVTGAVAEPIPETAYVGVLGGVVALRDAAAPHVARAPTIKIKPARRPRRH